MSLTTRNVLLFLTTLLFVPLLWLLIMSPLHRPPETYSSLRFTKYTPAASGVYEDNIYYTLHFSLPLVERACSPDDKHLSTLRDPAMKVIGVLVFQYDTSAEERQLTGFDTRIFLVLVASKVDLRLEENQPATWPLYLSVESSGAEVLVQSSFVGLPDVVQKLEGRRRSGEPGLVIGGLTAGDKTLKDFYDLINSHKNKEIVKYAHDHYFVRDLYDDIIGYCLVNRNWVLLGNETIKNDWIWKEKELSWGWRMYSTAKYAVEFYPRAIQSFVARISGWLWEPQLQFYVYGYSSPGCEGQLTDPQRHSFDKRNFEGRTVSMPGVVHSVERYKVPVNELVPVGLANLILYHAYVVMDCRGAEGGVLYWMSIEKNGFGLLFQASQSKEDVVKRFTGKERVTTEYWRSVSPQLIEQEPVGQARVPCSRVFDLVKEAGEFDKTYFILGDNCQRFSSSIFHNLSDN